MELLGVLAAGESMRSEFKVDARDDELVQTVVCLANGEGGVIVLGADDDGSVVGTTLRHGNDTDAARVVSLVANKTSPAHVVDVRVTELDGHHVVVVEVPRATSLVGTSSGTYLRRALDVRGRPQCLPMQPHEAVARLATIGEQDLSAVALPAATAEELDPLEMQRFRDLARRQGDSLLGELSDLDLLGALGFRTPAGHLTVGAVLMFGLPDAIGRHVPTHEVAFQVLDDSDVRVNRIERTPLVKSMVNLVAALEPYNPQDEVSLGLLRIPLPRYAEIAIRETLANALVHRNYAMNGQVRVAVEDDTLSITNPGSFPAGITIGNLLVAPPHARNPRLADAFKRAGLVERTGRGVNRVYRSQLSLGRPAPDYSRSTDAWVEVRFPAGPADAELAAFVAEAEREGRVDLRYLQVLHEVRHERRITTARAADLLQTGPDEARAELNQLVERGLLESRGEGKGRTYHLAAAVYRQLGDEAGYVRLRGFDAMQQEQMILNYVRGHGSISRGEAATLCQLSPDQASARLRSLTERGDLEMRGQRRTARYHLPGSRDV